MEYFDDFQQYFGDMANSSYDMDFFKFFGDNQSSLNPSNKYSKSIHNHISDIIAQVLGGVAILLNSLTLVVMARFSGKLTIHLAFVVNQCSLDLFLGAYYLVCPYFARAHLSMTIIMDQLYFVVWWLIFMNLIAMTIDHFIAIHTPLTYMILVTKKKVKILLGCTYGVCVLYIISLFVGLAISWRTTGEDLLNFWEWYITSDQSHDIFIGQYYVCMVLLFLCVITLISVYGYIVYKVRKSRHMLQEVTPETKNRHKAIFVSFFVILTFLFCICFHFAYFIKIHIFDDVQDLVGIYSNPLLPLNSVFDPLIYAIRLPKVRSGYVALWMLLRKKVLPPKESGSADETLSTRQNTSTSV